MRRRLCGILVVALLVAAALGLASVASAADPCQTAGVGGRTAPCRNVPEAAAALIYTGVGVAVVGSFLVAEALRRRRRHHRRQRDEHGGPVSDEKGPPGDEA